MIRTVRAEAERRSSDPGTTESQTDADDGQQAEDDTPPEPLTFTLSDPNWEWTGRMGYVQEHLDKCFDSFTDRDFYVYGVPIVLVQTKDRLAELGAPEKRIHSEGCERQRR